MLFNLVSRLRYFVIDFSGYLFLDIVAAVFLTFSFLKIHKSEKSEMQKKIYMMLIFTLAFCIFIFSFFEAYMRYKFDESDSLGFLKVNNKWLERHVVYNNYFVRDRDFVREKKQGTIRIGVIGDSIAMGYGIKNPEDRFSNILEKKFRQSGKNVEVYNLGKSGYDTQQEIDEYNNTFTHLQLDIVVWEYFLNDAQPREKSKGTSVLLREKAQSETAGLLSDKSYFFDYIYWRLAARYEKTFQALRDADMEAYNDKENFARHKKDIETFIRQLRDENKKIVVIMFPFIYFLPKYPALAIHNTMHAIFLENGIEPVDLYTDLKGKKAKDLIVSEFDYHPNEYVHKLSAERLYNKILSLLNSP